MKLPRTYDPNTGEIVNMDFACFFNNHALGWM